MSIKTMMVPRAISMRPKMLVAEPSSMTLLLMKESGGQTWEVIKTKLENNSMSKTPLWNQLSFHGNE